MSSTFFLTFSTRGLDLLPSRRVLAYDTSIFPLCQHLFSDFLRQHRTIWQEHSAKDFASYESYKRAGILYVFPPFITARMGQKIGRRPQTQLCGDALRFFVTHILWFLPLKYHYPLSRKGALYMPFYPGRRNHQGMVHSAAGPGGMWACRPTAVAEDAVGNTPLSGRPYRPPLRRTFGLVRRAGCPHPAEPARRNCRACGHRGLVMAACGHAALRRSTGVWRKSQPCPGGHTGRPYSAPLPSSLYYPGGPGLRAGRGVWYDRCNLIRRRLGWIYRLARSGWRPTGLR